MGERAVLVKFGKTEHILALQRDGLLYMNTLPYFRQVEGDEARHDPSDCADRLARGQRGHLSVEGKELPIEVTSWELRIGPAEPARINLFCMYALRPDAGTFPVDDLNAQFGEDALIITRPQEFMDRVNECLKANRQRARANLVEYVPDDHVGELGPMRKKNRFKYQSEWRIVLEEGPGEAVTFELGSIADISVVVRSQSLNEYVLEVWAQLFGDVVSSSKGTGSR